MKKTGNTATEVINLLRNFKSRVIFFISCHTVGLVSSTAKAQQFLLFTQASYKMVMSLNKICKIWIIIWICIKFYSVTETSHLNTSDFSLLVVHLSVHPYVCPTFVNMISQERLSGIYSNSVRISTLIQGWTYSISVDSGQCSRSLWPCEQHFWPKLNRFYGMILHKCLIFCSNDINILRN